MDISISIKVSHHKKNPQNSTRPAGPLDGPKDPPDGAEGCSQTSRNVFIALAHNIYSPIYCLAPPPKSQDCPNIKKIVDIDSR